jgi:hypothetical protein
VDCFRNCTGDIVSNFLKVLHHDILQPLLRPPSCPPNCRCTCFLVQDGAYLVHSDTVRASCLCMHAGLVLAVKQVDKEDDEIVVDVMRSMLSIFGAVSFGQEVTATKTPQSHLAIFEFFSIRDAAQAVEAVGNRSGSSFSLFLINSDGSPARVPPPMQLLGASLETTPSQISTHSERTGSSSVPLPHDDVADMQRTSHALFSSDSSHVAFLAAAHMHAQNSPLPPLNSAPSRVLPSVPVPPLALSHDWPVHQGVHMMQSMPVQQPPSRTPADFLNTFDPNEAAAGGARARTTIMIRNIPCRWTAVDLLSVLFHIIDGTWDLLYMPCTNTAVANAGYAFMNFCTPQDTLRLYNAMHGHQWPHTRSGKICEIRYARIQGRQLLTHLNSSEPSGAAAFRGYLAYPSGGTVVIHGPDNAQPALPMHPGMHITLSGMQGAQQSMDTMQYTLRSMPPAYAQGVPTNMPPRPQHVQCVPGMVSQLGGSNTAVADNTARPQELEAYTDVAQSTWPMHSTAYSTVMLPSTQYAMQMQPVGVGLSTTHGMVRSPLSPLCGCRFACEVLLPSDSCPARQLLQEIRSQEMLQDQCCPYLVHALSSVLIVLLISTLWL